MNFENIYRFCLRQIFGKPKFGGTHTPMIPRKKDTPMSRFYAKKILFNIAQADIDGMNEIRAKLGMSQSDFIRNAIRTYTAEKRVEIFTQAQAENG